MPVDHTDRTLRILGVLGQYPADELERRETAMRDAAPAGVEMGFSYMEGSVYRKGLTNLHRALVGPVVAREAREAQDAGYDAVVPYGTLDLGVQEARHAVDIPVIGPGQTAASVASTLADRFVVIVYDQPHVTMQVRLLRTWGVEHMVSSIRAVDIPITEMVAEVDRLRKRFVELARIAVEEEGAQLVVPMGMTMVPVLLSAKSLAEDIGVPVLDPLSLSLGLAATLARASVSTSRVTYPAASVD